MSLGLIIGITFIIVSLISLVILLISSNNSQKATFQNLTAKPIKEEVFVDDLDFKVVERKANGKYTLRQQMIYANWHFPPVLFEILRWTVAIMFFTLSMTFFKPFLSVVLGWIGYLIVSSFLERAIKKRFEAFDKDYPTFLQTVVSLLKSGMNALSAIESAAEGLEDSSLLKFETKKMLDRLKMGAGEEKAIGNFGASINHPEIELFIQTILLGKNLGGSLSTTLDRLAAQVRKRQYFRRSAISAIAQQKGSLWIILIIFTLLIVVMGIRAPELFSDALKTNGGHIALEGGISVVLLGIYWIKQIIKIKV